MTDSSSSLFQATPLPLVLTSEASGVVIAVNAAAEAASGRSAADLCGKTVLDCGHYESPGDRSAHVAQLGGSAVVSREVWLKAAGGEELRVLAHTSRITVEGAPCLLTALTTFTAPGRSEEGLRFAQRMEVIGKLSGGIAHEFNNLLTVMQGNLDALADELGDSPLRARVDTLHRSVAEAAHITSGLLTFAGRNPTQAGVIDLNAALHELGPTLYGTLGDAVTVEWHLTPAPVMARIGQAQLAQVVLNLALNAREAMPEGGRLVIGTDRVTLGRAADTTTVPGPGPWVVLRLADNGPGMRDDVRRHAFEPFFTTKDPGQGTGLGLSICRGIAEQAGGHLVIDSTLGEGTAVRLFLPASEEPAGMVTPPPGPQAALAASRMVLLVEDEPDVRNIVGEILRRAGHTVHVADGLASTRTLLDGNVGRIDLLLTDLVMPGGSGLEVARQVRAQHPGVSVVFMTGYSDAVFSGGELVEHLLQKPFTSKVLLDTIHAQLAVR